MYRLTIVVASATILFSSSGAIGQIPCPYHLRDDLSAVVWFCPDRFLNLREPDARMKERRELIKKKQAERLNAIIEEFKKSEEKSEKERQ
jgi:hypothetical protein